MGKIYYNFLFGEEEVCVCFVFEEVGKGKIVVLILFGDVGIYVMGVLVYELLDWDVDNGGVFDVVKCVSIINVFGILVF